MTYREHIKITAETVAEAIAIERERCAKIAAYRMDLAMPQEPGEWHLGYRCGMEATQAGIAERIRRSVGELASPKEKS